MFFLPLLVNTIVICVLIAELAGTALGMVSPDHLLVSSALSALLTMLSFKLSQEALLHINSEPAAVLVEEKQTPAEL